MNVNLQRRVSRLEAEQYASARVVVFANGFGPPGEYQRQLARAEEARRAGVLSVFFDLRPPGRQPSSRYS